MVKQLDFGKTLGSRNPGWKTKTREGIKQELLGQGKIKVCQYWKQRDNIPKWRTWDIIQTQDRNRDSQLVKDIEEEIGKRKIMISDEEDQLRWGRKDGGEFTLNEARHYIVGHDQRNTRTPMGTTMEPPTVAEDKKNLNG
jgi:hypothetical protein